MGFCLAAFMTLLLYALTTMKVAAIVKQSSSSSKAPQAIMKRGLLLTFTFIATWMWFIVCGGLAFAGKVELLPIQVDMVGAIILNAQPILDAFILLTLPNVRVDYLSRWLKAAGGSVGGSSSSSS